jgi:hypothetical protein
MREFIMLQQIYALIHGLNSLFETATAQKTSVASVSDIVKKLEDSKKKLKELKELINKDIHNILDTSFDFTSISETYKRNAESITESEKTLLAMYFSISQQAKAIQLYLNRNNKQKNNEDAEGKLKELIKETEQIIENVKRICQLRLNMPLSFLIHIHSQRDSAEDYQSSSPYLAYLMAQGFLAKRETKAPKMIVRGEVPRENLSNELNKINDMAQHHPNTSVWLPVSFKENEKIEKIVLLEIKIDTQGTPSGIIYRDPSSQLIKGINTPQYAAIEKGVGQMLKNVSISDKSELLTDPNNPSAGQSRAWTVEMVRRAADNDPSLERLLSSKNGVVTAGNRQADFPEHRKVLQEMRQEAKIAEQLRAVSASGIRTKQSDKSSPPTAGLGEKVTPFPTDKKTNSAPSVQAAQAAQAVVVKATEHPHGEAIKADNSVVGNVPSPQQATRVPSELPEEKNISCVEETLTFDKNLTWKKSPSSEYVEETLKFAEPDNTSPTTSSLSPEESEKSMEEILKIIREIKNLNQQLNPEEATEENWVQLKKQFQTKIESIEKEVADLEKQDIQGLNLEKDINDLKEIVNIRFREIEKKFSASNSQNAQLKTGLVTDLSLPTSNSPGATLADDNKRFLETAFPAYAENPREVSTSATEKSESDGRIPLTEKSSERQKLPLQTLVFDTFPLAEEQSEELSLEEQIQQLESEKANLEKQKKELNEQRGSLEVTNSRLSSEASKATKDDKKSLKERKLGNKEVLKENTNARRFVKEKIAKVTGQINELQELKHQGQQLELEKMQKAMVQEREAEKRKVEEAIQAIEQKHQAEKQEMQQATNPNFQAEIQKMQQTIQALEQKHQAEKQEMQQGLQKNMDFHFQATNWINNKRSREKQLVLHQQEEITKKSNIAIKRLGAFLIPVIIGVILTVAAAHFLIPVIFMVAATIGLILGIVNLVRVSLVNKFKTLPDIEERHEKEIENFQESWGKELTVFANSNNNKDIAALIVDLLLEEGYNLSVGQKEGEADQADPRRENVRQGMNALMHVWLGSGPYKLLGLYNYETGKYYFDERMELNGSDKTHENREKIGKLEAKMGLFGQEIIIRSAAPNSTFVMQAFKRLLNSSRDPQTKSKNFAICLAELLQNPHHVPLKPEQTKEIVENMLKLLSTSSDINFPMVMKELQKISSHTAADLIIRLVGRNASDQDKGFAAIALREMFKSTAGVTEHAFSIPAQQQVLSHLYQLAGNSPNFQIVLERLFKAALVDSRPQEDGMIQRESARELFSQITRVLGNRNSKSFTGQNLDDLLTIAITAYDKTLQSEFGGNYPYSTEILLEQLVDREITKRKYSEPQSSETAAPYLKRFQQVYHKMHKSPSIEGFLALLSNSDSTDKEIAHAFVELHKKNEPQLLNAIQCYFTLLEQLIVRKVKDDDQGLSLKNLPFEQESRWVEAIRKMQGGVQQSQKEALSTSTTQAFSSVVSVKDSVISETVVTPAQARTLDVSEPEPVPAEANRDPNLGHVELKQAADTDIWKGNWQEIPAPVSTPEALVRREEDGVELAAIVEKTGDSDLEKLLKEWFEKHPGDNDSPIQAIEKLLDSVSQLERNPSDMLSGNPNGTFYHPPVQQRNLAEQKIAAVLKCWLRDQKNLGEETAEKLVELSDKCEAYPTIKDALDNYTNPVPAEEQPDSRPQMLSS